MYAAPAALEPDVVHRVLGIGQLAVLALLAGMTAERVLGLGLRVRGLPLLCGLLGLYGGSWLWTAAEWAPGPVIAGYGLLPAFAGALAVSAVLRLVELALAGPRW
jgi:hypothetical protein